LIASNAMRGKSIVVIAYFCGRRITTTPSTTTVGFVGPVDDFIDWAFAYHSTQTRYQHYLLNHTAEVNGDEAHAETYYLFVGTDREPANHMTLSGGRYVDRVERRDGRWAIVDRVCVVEWNAESTNLITQEVLALLTDIRSATPRPQ